MAIIPDAPDTLLSIAVLTERGFEVRFLEHGRGVGIYKNQELMFHGPFDPTARLWHIDIASLICPPPSLDEREVNKVDLAFKETFCGRQSNNEHGHSSRRDVVT